MIDYRLFVHLRNLVLQSLICLFLYVLLAKRRQHGLVLQFEVLAGRQVRQHLCDPRSASSSKHRCVHKVGEVELRVALHILLSRSPGPVPCPR